MRKLLLLPLLLIVACKDTPAPPPKNALSFSNQPQIGLNVASVDVVEEYESTREAPNVELQFDTPPAEALKIWVSDRIRPAGSRGQLQVIVKDASVKETSLARTKGVKGVFTKDQAWRYDARMEVELRIYDGEHPISVASVNATATRSQTMREDVSVAQRQEIYNSITRDLMNDMNAELERQMRQYFSGYLVY